MSCARRCIARIDSESRQIHSCAVLQDARIATVGWGLVAHFNRVAGLDRIRLLELDDKGRIARRCSNAAIQNFCNRAVRKIIPIHANREESLDACCRSPINFAGNGDCDLCPSRINRAFCSWGIGDGFAVEASISPREPCDDLRVFCQFRFNQLARDAELDLIAANLAAQGLTEQSCRETFSLVGLGVDLCG